MRTIIAASITATILGSVAPAGSTDVLPERFRAFAVDISNTAQHQEAEGGRMIFLMTDRPIRMWEAMNRPRTIDYPFTLIQLQVDKDGNGVGKAMKDGPIGPLAQPRLTTGSSVG